MKVFMVSNCQECGGRRWSVIKHWYHTWYQLAIFITIVSPWSSSDRFIITIILAGHMERGVTWSLFWHCCFCFGLSHCCDFMLAKFSYWGSNRELSLGFRSHVSMLHSFCWARSWPQVLWFTIVLISTGYFGQNYVRDPFSFLVINRTFQFERKKTNCLNFYFFSTRQLKM